MSVTVWKTATLLASVKRRASLPVSQITLSDADLLDIANEELLTDLVPLIVSANEAFFLASVDYPIASTGLYRIPKRALGAKLHSVVMVDSDGLTEVPVGRLPANMPATIRLGFAVVSGFVKVTNLDAQPFAGLRMRYYMRPSRLVADTEVAYVTAVNGAALTLSTLPAALSAASRLDVLKGASPFDTLLSDAAGAIVGNVVTFPAAITGIEVDDLVTVAGQSNVPQLPDEWQPVLAQAVAVKALEALGDLENMAAAAAKLEQMKKAALGLVSNRVDGVGELVAPKVRSPWRGR